MYKCCFLSVFHLNWSVTIDAILNQHIFCSWQISECPTGLRLILRQWELVCNGENSVPKVGLLWFKFCYKSWPRLSEGLVSQEKHKINLFHCFTCSRFVYMGTCFLPPCIFWYFPAISWLVPQAFMYSCLSISDFQQWWFYGWEMKRKCKMHEICPCWNCSKYFITTQANVLLNAKFCIYIPTAKKLTRPFLHLPVLWEW